MISNVCWGILFVTHVTYAGSYALPSSIVTREDVVRVGILQGLTGEKQDMVKLADHDTHPEMSRNVVKGMLRIVCCYNDMCKRKADIQLNILF